MVDQAALLKDLQEQVKLLEDDLRERGQDPTAIKGTDSTGEPETFDASLKREYQRARDAERTAVTEAEWREGQITQAAVAWVLSTVFLRFCEDNGLLEQPFIAGPKDERDRYGVAQELKEAWVLQGRSENPDAPERTDRDWLEHAFEQMSVSSVMAGLFDKRHNPMWTITPSHSAAKQIIDFWRAVGEDGHLVHDFTDSEWNTRFLGDLYQDLSEATRKKYALLQTPEFVEEFILDYTLEPAIEEFGLDGNRIYQHQESDGFRLIDPTCGSGHFLLGAFRRLLNKWREAEPGTSDWDLISRSLRSVHGVDKNPYAVAIARFRLLIAAMKEGGIDVLGMGAPEWPIIVGIGDSLIHGRDVPGARDELFTVGESHRYSTEDYHQFSNEHDLLGAHSYHLVVGNPPYIAVKDSHERVEYRKRYSACSGAYALSVPFAQRFFNLAKRGSGGIHNSGFVGQITANSFMKREFGKRLVEDFFRNEARLTHVIDTSGAYIPGHGTPTVILVGRNARNSHKSRIRSILGVRGEPDQPKSAAEGVVWNAITRQVDNPGSESEWVSCTDQSWDRFSSHPWSLSGGGAPGVMKIISSASSKSVGDITEGVGFCAVTRLDDAYMVGANKLTRSGFRPERTGRLVGGEDVRDWSCAGGVHSVFPYAVDDGKIRADLAAGEKQVLWPSRSLLRGRKALSGFQEDIGLTWFEYSGMNERRFLSEFLIAFGEVSTHNNFALGRNGAVFTRTSPVISFSDDCGIEKCLGLLGVLNSSAICFWLKQVCHDKGNRGGERSTGRWGWEKFYQFNSTRVAEIPIPATLPTVWAAEIDKLSVELAVLDSEMEFGENVPRVSSLRKNYLDYAKVRSRMISLQEELDWDVYSRFNLVDEGAESVLLDASLVPDIKLGERSFEIVLARALHSVEGSKEWFKRHGSTPITEIPEHWPDAYKKVVAKRIELIESDKNINLLERPEYKRRWQSEPWEKKQKAALKSWLLDKCEDRRLWFNTDDYGDERAHPLSLRALANRVRDLFPEVAEVAALYDSSKDFGEVIEEIVKTEHVPYLAALRYKDTGLRKRADWEQVWDLQREEDKLNADLAEGEKEHRLDIPVPPKYTSADFRRNEYWSNRGKLDVPKERFVSYPGAETDTDSTLLLGWAGWDHAEQADALGTLAHERLDELGWGKDEDTRDKMVPLLAGMLELLPWVQQWHTEADEYGETPADHLRADLAELRDTTGITESEMKAWRPPSTRGRKKA
ncbi:BREX-2 system adenine-specific DNA-methyltransferase PglX [Nocardiopsis eucommiae]|uniref:BREX-2 system adenine-specific DNA-methyltransferase PglX n=1 Tax=Nocardiopsis eucommiae TaxID=2831970 RepID=UPI003D746465